MLSIGATIGFSSQAHGGMAMHPPPIKLQLLRLCMQLHPSKHGIRSLHPSKYGTRSLHQSRPSTQLQSHKLGPSKPGTQPQPRQLHPSKPGTRS